MKKNDKKYSKFSIQIRATTRELMDKMAVEENRSRSNLIDVWFMEYYNLKKCQVVIRDADIERVFSRAEKREIRFGKEKNEINNL